jgi:hypothetical protein
VLARTGVEVLLWDSWFYKPRHTADEGLKAVLADILAVAPYDFVAGFFGVADEEGSVREGEGDEGGEGKEELGEYGWVLGG